MNNISGLRQKYSTFVEKTVQYCLSHVTFHTPKKLRIKLKFSSFCCGKNEYNILRLSLKSSNLFSYHSGLVGLAANCNAWFELWFIVHRFSLPEDHSLHNSLKR